jgi:hypothetical protein
VRAVSWSLAGLSLFEVRPGLPGVPALLKLRLGLLQGRHPVGARHRTVSVHGPEPAQTVGSAAGLINAPDLPLAGKDGVVRPVLVDAGAEAGRAHGECHRWLLQSA